MAQIISDLFALLTVCCRGCICCSVFTLCGSIQSFAWVLFLLGLVAYPAGWGSEIISSVRILPNYKSFRFCSSQHGYCDH